MTLEDLDSELDDMRDLCAAGDEATGFIPLEPADYDAVMSALGERDDVARALAWLCLRKQAPQQRPWAPGTEIQGYLRAKEEEASKP